MKKILITNDDGIDSDGLIRLAKVAKEFGEVYVVAPDGQRSAMSHSIILRHAFEAWKVPFPVEGVHAFACNGQPADCVRIGVLNIVPGKPDYVFSGINYGYNIATDLQYSATVGAAMEGAFQGIHTIAFSESACENHDITDNYIMEVTKKLLTMPLEDNQIWNVNFPECSLEECKGIKWDVKVSREEFYRDSYIETKISEDRISYMVNGLRSYEAEEGTDFDAIMNNYVSVGVARNIS